MRFYYIILVCLQCLPLQAIVDLTVWVHGTYPALSLLRASWSPIKPKIYVEEGLSLAKKLPKHYYYHKLVESLHKIDPILYNMDHIYTYGWHSSNVSPKQRIKEGEKLYQALDKLLGEYLEKYKEVRLRIVGFSHGGNVILNMASHLPFKNFKGELEIILTGTPIQESTREFINNPYITRAYSFYSQGDWIQRIDVQRFHSNCPQGAPFLSGRMFKDTDKVQQVCLKINGKKIGHTRYRGILPNLADIMAQVKKDEDSSACNKILNLDYKFNKKKKKKTKKRKKQD